jgi:hypothetical protein
VTRKMISRMAIWAGAVFHGSKKKASSEIGILLSIRSWTDRRERFKVTGRQSEIQAAMAGAGVSLAVSSIVVSSVKRRVMATSPSVYFRFTNHESAPSPGLVFVLSVSRLASTDLPGGDP